MALNVAFHPLAETDLFGLYGYIAERGGATRAADYIDRIEALCATWPVCQIAGCPATTLRLVSALLPWSAASSWPIESRETLW